MISRLVCLATGGHVWVFAVFTGRRAWRPWLLHEGVPDGVACENCALRKPAAYIQAG